MKHAVDVLDSVSDAAPAADIPDVVFDFGVAVKLPHVVLLFFIPGKYPDFRKKVGLQKPSKDCVAKGSRTAGD